MNMRGIPWYILFWGARYLSKNTVYLPLFYFNSRSIVKTYKTTTSAPYGVVLHSYERILFYLQTFYAQF